MSFGLALLALVVLIFLPKRIAWALVILYALSALHISLGAAFLGFLVLCALAKIYEHFDRKKNPAYWAEADRKAEERRLEEAKKADAQEEENRPNVAREFWEEYQAATRRVPRSEWTEMNRYGKAEVFRRREQLKERFYALPKRTQDLIISLYPIDTSFPFE